MRLMELYGNDFSAEIIHEYYTSLKVKEWFTKGHTEETFKVAVIHYPIGHSDHTDASHLPKKNLMCLARGAPWGPWVHGPRPLGPMGPIWPCDLHFTSFGE